MSSELEKSKKELKNAINNENANIKKIFDISSNLTEQNLFQVKFNECNNIVKNKKSKELVNFIKQDLSKHYYGISEQELTIISLNIFDYSYLKAKNVAEDDIVRYICTKNAIYHDMLLNEEEKSLRVKANLKFFKYLIEKYTKIIKNEQ